MAQTPDAILAKLKELQATIPGIESSVARLQTLLKSGFGGSEGSLLAANTQLQNLTKNAEAAIAAMSNTTQAQTALNTLKVTISEVTTQLETLNRARAEALNVPTTGTPTQPTGGFAPSPTMIADTEAYRQELAKLNKEMAEQVAFNDKLNSQSRAGEQRLLEARLAAATTPSGAPATGGFQSGTFATLDARRRFEQEYAKLQAQPIIAPTVGETASAENYRLVTQSIQGTTAAKEASAQASSTGAAQEQTAAQLEVTALKEKLAAINAVIMAQRELYGVGQSGQFFTKSELKNNITAAAGGTRGLRAMTGGENADAYFARMVAGGEVVQNPNNEYQYKFTEANIRDIELYKAQMAALGKTAAETNAELEKIYGKRLSGGGTTPAAPQPSAAEITQQNLQNVGLRTLFGNDQQWTQFQDRLSQLKIGLGDVKRATTDVASGITTINFETLDQSTGVMRNATLYVDEFGRVVTQGTSKVKTFEDMITNNISKVLTWALALGVVYGSMQKIGELVQSMQKVQDAMIDIGITTKETADNLNIVYQAVLNISQATSTDLAGGLTAFNQALRATGGSADEATRVSTGLKLLSDSLTLAKLSGLETKRAMDLLIAGLKQLDQPLNSGSGLLDKFQAIANQANSSVEDMATTFAITAGAASDVGINVNHLVGLIGAFSEATSLSATETGNALRAMFSNFTQPQAVAVLNKYGIAVQDINGEFKSFIEIFQQASNLARSGVLGERQVAEIANALGGGSRRQAQVTALLTVAPRANTLTDFLDQGKEAGAAQEALAKKTGSLSSANERLANSFDNLAKSLGTEGGFIDFLTTTVDLLSKLIDLASQLTKALGPGLPLLLAGVAGYSILKTQGPALNKLGGQIFGGIGSPLANVNAATLPTYAQAQSNMGGIEGPLALGTFRADQAGTTFGKNALTSMLPLIPLLVGQISESSRTGDWSGTAGMAMGGAFMGVISGNPLWALVGALIGQAIVKGIQDNQKVIADAASAAKQPPTTIPEGATAAQIQEAIGHARQTLSQLAGADQELPGRWFTSRQERLRGIGADESLRAATEAFMAQQRSGLSSADAYNKLQNTPMTLPGHPEAQYNTSTAGFSQATLERAAAEMSLGAALDRATDAIKGLPENLQAAASSSAFLATKEAFVGSNKGIQAATMTGELIGTPEYEYNRKKRYEFTQSLAQGDLTPADYKNRMEAIGSTGITASAVVSAVNPNINTKNVQDYKDEWIRVKDALTVADEGTRTYVSNAAASLTTLNAEYVKLTTQQELYKRGLSDLDATGYATLVQRLQDVGVQSDIARNQIEALLKSIEDTNNAAKFSFKGFGDYTKYNAEEMQQLIQAARGLQDIYSQQTQTPLDQLIKTAPDIVTMTKDGFSTWHGVYQQFLDGVLTDVDNFRNQMEEKMKFNFKSLRNVPAEMAQRLQQAMNYYTNLLKNYGFNERNDLITVLFKDNQVGQLVGSQTALQLALEDLTQVEKKKLDGIYNLPSGATAYIPLQAGQLLSEYTNNTMGAGNVNYGATPSAPPVPGTYPLGKPPSELSDAEILKRMLREALTPLQQAASDLGAIKYGPTWKPSEQVVPPMSPSYNKPWYEQFGIKPPETPMPKTNDPALAALDTLVGVSKQMYGSFASVAKLFSALGGTVPFMDNLKGATKVGAEAPPVNIKITAEKQQIDTSVNMIINLDSRRLWEGIKKVAMADYARLTASVGDTQRSRGNVI